MKIDLLSNLASEIDPAAAGLITAFTAAAAGVAPGKYPLDGDRVLALVQEYAPRDYGRAKLEIHRRYIDIHVPLEGAEMLCFASVAAMPLIEDFTPRSDDVLYELDPAAATTMVAAPGHFVSFAPGEGHSPGLRHPASPERARKIVFKVEAPVKPGEASHE